LREILFAMSDATAEHSETPLFTVTEIEQFDADDVTAGRAIGKMLSILFLYTVFAMSLVSWWTFRSIRAHSEAQAPATDHQAH
jgi:hypothetical protein